MVKGRITQYSDHQGFGYIQTEDGQQLLFDFEGCDFNPTVGDEVEVLEIGKRFDGSPKAKRVVCPAKAHKGNKPPSPKTPF